MVELVLESRFYEDEALLQVLQEMDKDGLIEKHQELAVKARAYFHERFDFMEKENLLGFIEIFNKHGMLFEDKTVALQMKDHFATAFATYELP